MKYINYIQEIPYKNLKLTSYCDSCGISFNRQYLFRFKVRNIQIKVCTKCKVVLFNALSRELNHTTVLADNLDLQYQIVEQADTIKDLIEVNRQLNETIKTIVKVIRELK